MGFLDRLFGREPGSAGQYPPPRVRDPAYQQGYAGPSPSPQDAPPGANPADEQAIARYRYLLRTAPPEQVEEAHAEAFGKLTPEQRQKVLAEMSQTLPPHEQPQSDAPRQLARAATRAELSQPGYMQRTFGGTGWGAGVGMGMGGILMGSMLGSIAGVVIGTAVADMFLGGFDGSPEAAGADLAGGAGGSAVDPGSGADYAGGGGFGDFGGGDFGGGDFGGGDFGGDF